MLARVSHMVFSWIGLSSVLDKAVEDIGTVPAYMVVASVTADLPFLDRFYFCPGQLASFLGLVSIFALRSVVAVNAKGFLNLVHEVGGQGF
jgi:hypothetical protein